MTEPQPVALLADVYPVLPALLAEQARGNAGATLRLAELLRRFFPSEAIRLVDSLEPTTRWGELCPDLVRAAALLEDGALEEVRVLLPFLEPGPRATLLEARLLLAAGDLDAADNRLSAIIPTEDPEIEAEARSFRVRLRLGRRQEVGAELDALEALCAAHQAGISQTLVRVLRELQRAGVVPVLEGGLLLRSRAELEARYCFGLEHERSQVAPIPLAVHGVARAHARDPGRFVGALLAMGSLDWRLGQRARAWPVLWYGLRIGERIHGPLPQLRSFADQIWDGASEEERGRMMAALTDAQ